MNFSNDKSRLIRGIAIIFMVIGHTLPGKIYPFAVPLFSFLVGYGFEFAKKKDWHNFLYRTWHLLKGFWIILFLICLPIAIFYTHYQFTINQLILNMFGLWGGLNFYCWYVYFYILCMAVLPFSSNIIDRYGIKSLCMMCIICGGLWLGIKQIHNYDEIITFRCLERFFRYYPIVITAYYISHFKIFSKIKFAQTPKLIIPYLLIITSIYLIRKYEWLRTFDMIWASSFAVLTAALLDCLNLNIINIILTELGKKSMNIWFLHALFFTHSTRKLFLPVVTNLQNPVILVIVILISSYLMAICVEFIKQKSEHLLMQLKLQKFNISFNSHNDS